MYQVDPDWHRTCFFDGASDDSMSRNTFWLNMRPGTKWNVPHILDDQTVATAFDQGMSVTQSVFDDSFDTITGVAWRPGQRPTVNHADDRFWRAKDRSEIFDTQRVKMGFPGWCHSYLFSWWK
jgi:hypothetical protein